MIVAANWKMNLSLREAAELVAAYAADMAGHTAGHTAGDVAGDTAGDMAGDVVVGQLPQRILFAPFPYLVPISMRLGQSDVLLGAQDCHAQLSGAYTGDVAAPMLVDCGAKMVLLGHSERRAAHNESDELVRQKAVTALAAGLDVMICVGETATERDAGDAISVIRQQLVGSIPPDCATGQLTVAYEPVWAIGTGNAATLADIAAMHDDIRSYLDGQNLTETAILYGGSVKPDNAADIFNLDNVGGALVGGASLDAGQFTAICAAAAGR